jgi:cell division protein ZapA
MPQLTIRINGYPYTVGCEDGEEAHLQAMVEQVEQRIDKIKQAGGQSGEARLLAMAALLMADELFEQGKELDAQRKAAAKGAASEATTAGSDPKLGRRLGKLAKRAEDIAADLERT